MPDARGSAVYSLPHARGGVSGLFFLTGLTLESSPRTWGCFQGVLVHFPSSTVFPTHVGVFPSFRARSAMYSGLPHARGGVSSSKNDIRITAQSSPRTWGCFFIFYWLDVYIDVFPTHVGVFLVQALDGVLFLRLPHARGGVSGAQFLASPNRRSSPRTWGCFSAEKIAKEEYKVFPTHVGVFPLNHYQIAGGLCLPHARGGVSRLVRLHGISRRSSPRTWGCFPVATLDIDYYASSPRTWGCF